MKEDLTVLLEPIAFTFSLDCASSTLSTNAIRLELLVLDPFC